MKSLVLIVALTAVFAAGGSADRSAPRRSGVYLSAADYKDRRLTAEGDCGSRTHRLELHDVLNKPYIHVTHGTEKRRYEKSSLFGFRACDGNDYRFVGNQEYQILEARELYIYLHERYVTVGKSRHIERDYYFSVGPDGEVLRLTLENLKEAFPGNHVFRDSLDQAFGTRQDPAQYDEFHKMFKVNRLLIASETSKP